MYNISENSVKRWAKAHSHDQKQDYDQRRPGREGRPGDIVFIGTTNRLTQREISGQGARSIKHQSNVSCSWITIHRILKKHGLPSQVKAKPHTGGKRFQLRHFDSI